MAKVGRELGIQWSRSAETVTRQVESFLSREMRHHVSEGEVLATRTDVVPWVKDVYRWAQNAVAGHVGDLRELDEIGSALHLAELAYHPILAANETRLTASLRQELTARDSTLAQQLEHGQALAAALAERETSLAAEVRHGQDLAAELHDLRPLIANIVDNFGQASQGLEHAVRLAGEARADLGSRLNEATARASNLEEARVSMAREIATAAAHATHAVNRIADLDAECAELNLQIEAAQRQANELLAERDGYLRQLTELRSEASQFKQQAQEMQAEATQHAKEAGELAQQLATARASLAQAAVHRDATRHTFHQQTLIIERLRRQVREWEVQARLDRSSRMDIEDRFGALEQQNAALEQQQAALEQRTATLDRELRDGQIRAEQTRTGLQETSDRLRQEKLDLGLQLEELQRVKVLLEQYNKLLADRNELLTRLVRPIPGRLRRFVKRLLTQA
jgi:chromosome segregation ATPase